MGDVSCLTVSALQCSFILMGDIAGFMALIIIIIINHYIYIVFFLALKALYIEAGISSTTTWQQPGFLRRSSIQAQPCLASVGD